MMFGKKAQLNEKWVELISLIVLVLGFILAFSALGSLFLAYALMFLWGLFFGRVWYEQRRSMRFTWFLVLLGFYIGYLLGVSIRFDASGWWIFAIIYLLGIYISYYLHVKKYIKAVGY